MKSQIMESRMKWAEQGTKVLMVGGGSQIGILYKAMIVYSMTILELAFFPHTMPCYKYMYRIFRI